MKTPMILVILLLSTSATTLSAQFVNEVDFSLEIHDENQWYVDPGASTEISIDITAIANTCFRFSIAVNESLEFTNNNITNWNTMCLNAGFSHELTDYYRDTSVEIEHESSVFLSIVDFSTGKKVTQKVGKIIVTNKSMSGNFSFVQSPDSLQKGQSGDTTIAIVNNHD